MDKPMHMPWGIDEIKSIHQVSDVWIRGSDGEPIILISRDIAKLIITAVNRTPAFEAMVAALEKIKRRIGSLSTGNSSVTLGLVFDAIIEEIEIALKLAKAETPAPQDEGVLNFVLQRKV
jgi:hypothetical protein